MKVILEKVSEEEFGTINADKLFGDIALDRNFGIISADLAKFKFSWQSTDIDPKLVNISESIYALGVDLAFTIIDFSTGKIHLNLSLDYFFYDVKINNEFIYVITELEIIKLKIKDFSLAKTYGLPEIFSDMEFKNGAIIVKCLDGQILEL